jgi:toxin FitB
VHLLDTEVLWALRGQDSAGADGGLFEWAAAQMPSTLFVSAVSLMEFENGAKQLDRRDKATGAAIRRWLDERLRPAFHGRVIAIDDAVVRRWSQLGYADFRDGVLAASALEHRLTLATRDGGHFRSGKVRTVNPWTYTPDADELDWRRASQSAPLWLKSLFTRA